MRLGKKKKKTNKLPPKKKAFNCIYSSFWSFPVIKNLICQPRSSQISMWSFLTHPSSHWPNILIEDKLEKLLRGKVQDAIKTKFTGMDWGILDYLLESNIITRIFSVHPCFHSWRGQNVLLEKLTLALRVWSKTKLPRIRIFNIPSENTELSGEDFWSL